MALNIKNHDVETLAAELAAMTGESKTQTIRRALEERRDRLQLERPAPQAARELRKFLEREVWPAVPDVERGRRMTKAEEEKILGFGKAGA